MKQKHWTVYKVTFSYDSINWSYCKKYGSGVALQFNKRTYTLPKFGRILAFDNLSNAENYVNYGDRYFKIWEARTRQKPEAAPHSTMCPFANTGEDLIELFWKDYWTFFDKQKRNQSCITRFNSFPPGTISCADLRLVKEIQG